MDDIAREVRMLKYRVGILRRKYGSQLLPVDEARMLQTECELYEKSVIKWWCGCGIPRADAIRCLRNQFNSVCIGEQRPDGFDAWIEDHFDIHDEARSRTSDLCFRCSEESCIHYIYGLTTIEELKEHFKKHRNETSSSPLSISQEDHLPQNEASITGLDASEGSALDADFVYVSFDSSSAAKHKAQEQPARRRKSKRRNAEVVVKNDRQKDPCLRCKILKKECDDETPCKQCPQQGDSGKGDFWKVLGCFRNLPNSLATIFLPDSLYESLGLTDDLIPADDLSAFWCQKLSQGTPLLTNSQDFVTFAEGLGCSQNLGSFTKFLSKLRDPGHTFKDNFLMRWLPAVWALFKIHTCQFNSRHPALDICILFENASLAIHTAYEVEMLGLAILLLEQSSFRPMQAGNSMYSNTGTITVSKTPSTICDACRRQMSKCLILEGQETCVPCQFYEQICSFVSGSYPQSENLNGKGNGPLGTVSNNVNERIKSDVLIYLSGSIGSLLNTTLSRSCSRRKCLIPEDWFRIFAVLCCCSILKSLLIDVQTEIGVTDDGAQAGIDARVDSAYKILVSVFAWAAKSDLLVEWYRPAGMEDQLTGVAESEKEIFTTLCRLVQRDEWEKRGIRSSKDFLMGLGSGFYNDGNYNGFYIQRYGLKEPQKSKNKSLSQENEILLPISENGPKESAPRPPHIRKLVHLEERVEIAAEQRNGNTEQGVSGTYQQHVEEGSSSPIVVPMVGLSQSHDSVPQEVTGFLSLPGLIAPYVCIFHGCEELRFASLEEFHEHEWSVHARVSHTTFRPCVCPLIVCERRMFSKVFHNRQGLVDHMRSTHNIVLS